MNIKLSNTNIHIWSTNLKLNPKTTSTTNIHIWMKINIKLSKIPIFK